MEHKIEVAVFRYAVISDFVNGAQMSRIQRKNLLREKSSRKYDIPFSIKTRISQATIRRWIKLYIESNGDLMSLCPKRRSDNGKSRVLDEDTCLALIHLRKELPAIPIDKLIQEMTDRKLVTPGITLYPSTVYRLLNQHELMKQALNRPVDRRKFEAELPNDLWQSDVMHGPKIDVNGRLRKTYLIAIIDDHSRLIVHAMFYLSEALSPYLKALEDAFLRRGLPRKLYVDNGAAFRSKRLEYICASLNIMLIHAKPYQPQGKGKIERWFKTVRSSFLSTFTGETLAALNDALKLWIDGSYHVKKHGPTGQTPFQRFTASTQCLRPSPENLKDHFRNIARRTVNKDRTVTLNGRLYEAPVALIGKRVELLYHDEHPNHVEVKYNQKCYGTLKGVDPHINCKVKRDKNNNTQLHTTRKSKYKGFKLL